MERLYGCPFSGRFAPVDSVALRSVYLINYKWRRMFHLGHFFYRRTAVAHSNPCNRAHIRRLLLIVWDDVGARTRQIVGHFRLGIPLHLKWLSAAESGGGPCTHTANDLGNFSCATAIIADEIYYIVVDVDEWHSQATNRTHTHTHVAERTHSCLFDW